MGAHDSTAQEHLGLGGELWAEERVKWCSGARGKELLLLPPEHGKCFSSTRVM